MDKETILVVDDEKEIRDLVGIYLSNENFKVIKAANGLDALDISEKNEVDLIILDIMMPNMDGIEACMKIREDKNMPIIMLSAKSEDMDKIMGLTTGADDYVIKPFSPGELMARIRAVLRRIDVTDEQKKNVIRYPQLEIYIADYKVKVKGEHTNLTRKEIEILWLLACNPNKVFSRGNLLDSIWGYDYCGDYRTVDTHIKRLRAKLNLKDQYIWDIKTIWGVGYQFEVQDV